MKKTPPAGQLDDVFVALADETRRSIPARLSAGEARVTELAAPLEISLNSVSRSTTIMKREDPIAITVQHRFRQSAERVFDAWLDVGLARRLLFSTASGDMVRCDIDPQVGGRFVLTDRRPEGDVEHTGEYLLIERPVRLVGCRSASGWIGVLPDGCADRQHLRSELQMIETRKDLFTATAAAPEIRLRVMTEADLE